MRVPVWLPRVELNTQQKPKEANTLNTENIFRKCSHYDFINIGNRVMLTNIPYWLIKKSKHGREKYEGESD